MRKFIYWTIIAALAVVLVVYFVGYFQYKNLDKLQSKSTFTHNLTSHQQTTRSHNISIQNYPISKLILIMFSSISMEIPLKRMLLSLMISKLKTMASMRYIWLTKF